MTQWLRVLAALAENPSQIPIPRWRLKPITEDLGALTASSGPFRQLSLFAYTLNTDTNTHTINKNKNFN